MIEGSVFDVMKLVWVAGQTGDKSKIILLFGNFKQFFISLQPEIMMGFKWKKNILISSI